MKKTYFNLYLEILKLAPRSYYNDEMFGKHTRACLRFINALSLIFMTKVYLSLYCLQAFYGGWKEGEIIELPNAGCYMEYIVAIVGVDTVTNCVHSYTNLFLVQHQHQHHRFHIII